MSRRIEQRTVYGNGIADEWGPADHETEQEEAIYEYHSKEHHDAIAPLCEAAGLVCVRDEIGPFGPPSGVAVWVRP